MTVGVWFCAYHRPFYVLAYTGAFLRWAIHRWPLLFGDASVVARADDDAER
ncbi:hypothetical protein KCP77_23970 [Salmonella enterica subsp. enterica]|nr:hypothetical protein KCP77_23970 [Salmonella enterica subsp. enterica]